MTELQWYLLGVFTPFLGVITAILCVLGLFGFYWAWHAYATWKEDKESRD